MNLLSSNILATASALAVVCGMFVKSSFAEGDSVEVRELRAALAMSQKQAADAEVQRKALVQSLSEAVRVSEEQMVAARETELKLQAFGVDLFAKDENGLEQRLLKAVRDLDISQQEIERQNAAIQSLSEAFLKYIKSTPEVAEADRKAAETSIQQASAAMARPAEAVSADPGDISASQVVSIDPEIGLVVFNAGRSNGIIIGTPITILREDRPIYTATIVDVRDSISGAVLQDKVADVGDVAVGDGIKLLPNQNSLF